MATTTTAPENGGRPRNEDSPASRATCLRWLITHRLLGQTLRAIGLAEQPPVSEATVSRGVAWAKSYVSGPELLAVLARLGLDRSAGAA
jgi:hypothetical protein